MDLFKVHTINNYSWEMSFANEMGKKKIQHRYKKRLRKLSRTRLKQELVRL
jgi:hypothetical protein